MYNSAGNADGHFSSPGSSGSIRYPVQRRQVYQPVMVPVPPPPSRMFFSASRDGDDDADFPFRDDGFPEWSNQEIRDFIEIKAQLEWDFSVADRNKDLWETVANRMRERGYLRTPDQCKGKWKFLKGPDIPLDDGQQSLFYDEMPSVSCVRTTGMAQQHALESEMVPSTDERRTNKVPGNQWNEECSVEEEDIMAAEAETVPRKKVRKQKQPKSVESSCMLIPTPLDASNDGGFIRSIQEIMRRFIQQQKDIDMQWRKRMEKQAEERELFEQEWRQKMETLEREKLMVEKTQSEREERRRVREEIRAEKRDVLLTALLNKLIKDDTS